MNNRTHCSLLAAMLLLVFATAHVQAAPSDEEATGLAPTYTIFATREGLVGQQTANGHIIEPHDHFVALPSWRNLAPLGTNTYQVRLTYHGRSVVVPVWDVGPWNTHDDYWSPNRESYRDLPMGVPMAQAAYLEGYNGGLDEFGRRILQPNGIDIADGAFWDDLGMSNNDWVQVSFLWLGEDPGPGIAEEVSPPIQVTDPDPDEDAPVPPDRTQPSDDEAADPSDVATPTPKVELDNPQIEDGAIAIDNDDAGYSASQADWETAPCGVNGDHMWTFSTTSQTKRSNRASWTASLPASGTYEVQAYIPACGTGEPTQEANYHITHDKGQADVTIDQQASAGTWVSLGTYRFGSRQNPLVELTDLAGDDGKSIRFDAIAWIPQAEPTEPEPTEPEPTGSDTTPPDARIVSITPENNGYLVAWDGTDDSSGIASYDIQVRQLPKGGWRTWLKETTDREAWFGPDEDKQFAFRIRARDRVGNEEPWPENADITTKETNDGEEHITGKETALR